MPESKYHPELQTMIEQARVHMKYEGSGVWSDSQLLASYALASLQMGYHHITSAIKPAGPDGVTTFIIGAVSTFDYDWLTRAVLLAHKMGVRIEIVPSGGRRLKINAHTRVTSDAKDETIVDFMKRHPSLDHLIKRADGMKLWKVAGEGVAGA